MNLNPFKPGDKIRCKQIKETHHANWSHLAIGDVYTVNIAYAYSRILRLQEIDDVVPEGLHFHADDFEFKSSSTTHEMAYDRAMKGVC